MTVWTPKAGAEVAKRFLGDGWRLLDWNETLKEGDQTARVSLLLSVNHYEGWLDITEDLGQTIEEWVARDGDRNERVFRRRT